MFCVCLSLLFKWALLVSGKMKEEVGNECGSRESIKRQGQFIQMRGDGGLAWDVTGGGSEKWSDSRCSF